MGMPTDAPIIDLMLSFPILDLEKTYGNLRAAAKDKDSKEFEFPAQYMFKGVPHGWGEGRDPVEVTLEEMDKWSIKQALVGVGPLGGPSAKALANHPDRFLGNVHVDPNDVMGAVRQIEEAHQEFDVRMATTFPAGNLPQIMVDDPQMYPMYAKCCELDIAVGLNMGVPGPRLPMDPQKVERLDRICYDFPELRIVTYHGCEPWEDLAVKLMLKWPGLHYCTSAFAPKHYPEAIIKYANTRGADKILYAGYFPMGLSLERIMTEMKDVPFRDHVWPKFLYENARRVLKIED
ncbi:MAG: amidohydrolase family protein [bacterium]|nr:amidohydrolase family protein [bacterium]